MGKSWQAKPAQQQPVYADPKALERAVAHLSRLPPIVVSWEIDALRERLAAALQALAEAQSIPVAHTMSGKGGIPCTHPLNVGLFGRYARIANELIEASDCLIVVGCKLGEIATKRYALPPRHIPIIHLEIVAEEIGRCFTPEVALWGDARAGLEDLAETLAEPPAINFHDRPARKMT